MLKNEHDLLAILTAVLLIAPPLDAQRGKRDKDAWKKDPYTLAEPEAMEKAGYVSFGPFAWGDDGDTGQIEHVLGKEIKMRWVETAHFKIGSSLPRYKIPRNKKETKTKIAAELKELRRKLPRVKTNARELDPWLRLHLYAHRCEKAYAEFQERLGVTDASFPVTKSVLVGGKYMGEGRYLGQPAKFTVLLFEKKGTCGHYLTNFLRMPAANFAIRHNFMKVGSLLYCTATEYGEGNLANDTAMHCELAFNLAHGFVDGYRYYTHPIPHWFRQGLAHWYLRRVSPEYPVFNEYVRFDNDPEMMWNWPPRVRARVKHGVFPTAEELLAWTFEDEKKLTDSMMLWSRVDYLMSLEVEGFRTFMNMMKGRIPMAGGIPTREEILAQQAKALRAAWDLDPASFDERWSRWVLKTYPRR